jgi:CubicO group peptidase (beta-lactamase class C family)
MSHYTFKPFFSFSIKSFLLVLIMTIISGCNGGDNAGTNLPESNTTNPTPESFYFPPVGSSEWETTTMEQLDWNTSAVQPLKDYLAEKHTKSFMILVNGRIVMEEYMNDHNSTEPWEWNSAGKTLVSATIGIAQQEGLVSITNKASDYLGTGWTSEPSEKENLITIRHLLTMTSGINDESSLVIKPNLTYLADAGTRWSYSNVFQKLIDVVSATNAQDFETYFNTKLKNKIGMEGFWNYGVIFTIYHSNTRSMARFGLLALNKGKWNNEQILNENFFNEAISSSQEVNPSYGYLWWLNGKTSYMVPSEQTIYQGALVPNAPSDMYVAMGANDQRIYVVPSKKMVIVRMGDASDPANPSNAISEFDVAVWEKINALIK